MEQFIIDIHLSSRTISASLSKPEGTVELLAKRSYSCLFEWVHIVLTNAAINLGFVNQNDTSTPDPQGLLDVLNSQQLKLRLHGEVRELRVLELVLMLETKCSLEQVKQWCEQLPSPAKNSVYDDYNVSSMVDLIDQFNEDYRTVNDLIKKLGLPEYKISQDNDSVLGSVLKSKQITLGILGNTGAGKTTLLNALLHETKLFPTDTDICTTIPSIISYAETAQDVGYKIHTLPRSEIDALISPVVEKIEEYNILSSTTLGLANASINKEIHELLYGSKSKLTKYAQYTTKTKRGLLHSGSSGLKSEDRSKMQEALPQLKEELESWIRFLNDPIPSRKQSGLSRLSKIISTECPAYWKPVIKYISVYLHKPLLKHMRLVDAAGLMDRDESRVNLTKSILSKLNGWILVHNADQRGDYLSSLLKWVKRDASIPDGVICLTKVDALLSQSDEKLEFKHLLKKRLENIDQIVESKNTERTFCSPKATEVFLSTDIMSEDSRVKCYEAWTGKTFGFKMKQGWNSKDFVKLNAFKRKRFDDQLIELFESMDSNQLQTFSDFQYELSGVISTVSTVVQMVQKLINQIVSDFNYNLFGYLEMINDDLIREKDQSIKLLDATNRKFNIEKAISNLDGKLERVESDINRKKKELDRTNRAVDDIIQNSTNAFAKDHESKIQNWVKIIRDQIYDQRRDSMSGKFKVNPKWYNAGLNTNYNSKLRAAIDLIAQGYAEIPNNEKKYLDLKLTGLKRNTHWCKLNTYKGYEKFFEYFETTLIRARSAIEKDIEQTYTINVAKFSTKLDQCKNLLNNICKEKDQIDLRKKESLLANRRDLQANLSSLNINEKQSTEELEKSINVLNQKIELCRTVLNNNASKLP